MTQQRLVETKPTAFRTGTTWRDTAIVDVGDRLLLVYTSRGDADLSGT